jgi:hypothetical protein
VHPRPEAWQQQKQTWRVYELLLTKLARLQSDAPIVCMFYITCCTGVPKHFSGIAASCWASWCMHMCTATHNTAHTAYHKCQLQHQPACVLQPAARLLLSLIAAH